jgi:hypothetical protein
MVVESCGICNGGSIPIGVGFDNEGCLELSGDEFEEIEEKEPP